MRDQEGGQPSTKDGSHHGIASRKSPRPRTAAPDQPSAFPRDGCVSAAPANSTAVNAFTAGCSVNWPVSSAPGGTRTL